MHVRIQFRNESLFVRTRVFTSQKEERRDASEKEAERNEFYAEMLFAGETAEETC